LEEIASSLISNKLYLIAAALIIAVIIYALLKKIIKLMVIILIAAAIYIAVVHHSGGKLPEKLEQIKNTELNGEGEISRFKENLIHRIINNSTGQSSSSSSEKR